MIVGSSHFDLVNLRMLLMDPRLLVRKCEVMGECNCRVIGRVGNHDPFLERVVKSRIDWMCIEDEISCKALLVLPDTRYYT